MGSGWSDALTATDASFLRIETDQERQHVGSLSILEGDPTCDERGRTDTERLLSHVGRPLHRVPRLPRRPKEAPFGQAWPVWIDDDRFDLDNEGLTMAVVSYDDHLFFGVKSDRDVLPELDQLASGIDREFRSLLDAAGVLEQKG